MKKILLVIMFFIGMISVNAQLPITSKVKNLSTVNEGYGLTVAINPAFSDTLKSADTLFYKVMVNHSYVIYPYISLLTKLVSSDTTSTLTLWQSVDGVHNWQAIQNETAAYIDGTYSVTLAKSTTTGTQIDFWQNKIFFQSTYLGIRIIAKTKSNFKTIYYGSIRVNKL